MKQNVGMPIVIGAAVVLTVALYFVFRIVTNNGEGSRVNTSIPSGPPDYVKKMQQGQSAGYKPNVPNR